MTRLLALLFVALCWPGCLRAQLDLLTLREAESLVERIPDVAGAAKEGACPSLSGIDWTADEFELQVRRECGPSAGQLIRNYTVNRRTGEVRLFGDEPLLVADPAVQALGQKLVLKAQTRTLSIGEARCLALRAAKSFPGWSETGSSVSVEQSGKAEYGRALFYARLRSPIRRVDIGHSLSVDLTTAWIRDDETGTSIMSEGLGSLTAKILALRAPALLSNEDATSIALSIPPVSAQLGEGCVLSTGGAFHSEEAPLRPECGGQYAKSAGLTVNLRTGHAADADTGKSLDSGGSLRLTQDLLRRIQRTMADLREQVDALCRAE